MMSSMIRMLLGICILALVPQAFAEPAGTSAARAAGSGAAASSVAPTGGTEAAIKRALEDRMPGISIVGVDKTGYDGLYEVRTEDNEIFYTDDKVNYIFVGTIRDGRNPERNFTEERVRAITAVPFDHLPFEDSFKIVRGTGKRKVAYFSDPNCPYCKQLERELIQLNDVTVHVFLYPILTADSAPKAKAIWCSNDRGKAWLDWMLNGTAPATPVPGCNAQSVDRNLAFGRKIRVNSVPTLVFADGTRVSGVPDRDGSPRTLAKMLDEASSGTATAH